MNQVNSTQKDRVMKSLAIFGFVGVVVLGVWLAVQIVSLMPQAFNSLASIADGVYNYKGDEELKVSTSNSTVDAGEAFEISWNEISTAGAYTFSYACADGVSVEIKDANGSAINANCDEAITLGDSTTNISVTPLSERHRSSDVSYSVAFIAQGETEPLTVSDNTVTVINPSIPEGDTVASTEDEETQTDENEEESEEGDTETESTETEETPITTTPPPVNETIVLETPVSDPYGYTDLAIRIVAVGHLDSNGNFIPRGNVESDAKAAFQFEVKNIGTKTSTDWTFDATLTSGSEYTAPAQSPLKPQERVVFTLGYDDVGPDGISVIGATVRGGDDINANNNSFTWAVSVVE